MRPAEVDILLGDPSKAERVLGWRREVDFPGLVRRMVQHDIRLLVRRGLMQMSRAQRVAVTGVNGFVGRHLVAELLSPAVGRRRRRPRGRRAAPDGLSDYVEPGPDRGLAARARRRRRRPPRRALRRRAVVRRPAALPRPRTAPWSPTCARACSADSPRLAGARGQQRRRVRRPPAPPLTEDSRIGFSSPYVVSKVLVENQVAYYAGRGLDAVVARPFNHIGPGQGAGLPGAGPPRRRRGGRGDRRRRCAWATSTPAGTTPTCATWSVPTGCWSRPRTWTTGCSTSAPAGPGPAGAARAARVRVALRRGPGRGRRAPDPAGRPARDRRRQRPAPARGRVEARGRRTVQRPRLRHGVSRIIVIGPSLTEPTCMSAPKLPSATVAPRSRSAAQKAR